MNAIVNLYQSAVQEYGEGVVTTACISGVNALLFTLLNLWLTLCYRNDWFQKQRIRPAGKMPPDDLVKRALIQVMLSAYLVAPISFYYGVLPLLQWRNCDLSGQLPSAIDVLADMVIFLVLEDTLFYWIHRGLHHRSIYKYIHKQHHQFRNCIGIAAIYAHPVESVVGVMVPLFAGPLLCRTNFWTLQLWTFLRLWESIDSHSGYEFEWSPWFVLRNVQGGAARHDYHHSHNIGSYGTFTQFWDWAMGTDKPFKAYMAKQAALHASSKGR
eukprot:TRINITY_DN981_c0_g1_i1.p1 TRINITY_DN981_c0_g1~~TRINITY_DN981_c0_g1_i1.p1  ORF type:complete len:270 (+),score=30.95 TRINITY_DN981_c0_g1_i1:85-894(+)